MRAETKDRQQQSVPRSGKEAKFLQAAADRNTVRENDANCFKLILNNCV
jgi:hypothetical protein